jgi:hypothetical protein
MIPLLLSLAAAWAGQTYTMNQRVASSASLPLFGRAITYTDSLLLLRTEPTSTGLAVSQEVCRVVIDDPLPVADTRIPDPFLRALGVRDYTIVVGEAGGQATWTADQGPEAVGFDPRLSATLPLEATAAGVTDWDQDGQPGATVLVDVRLFGTVSIYVVQQAHTQMRGTVQPDGAVEGAVEVLAFAQKVIGASHPLFHASPELVWRPAQSRFRAEPVAQGTSCDDLRAGRVAAPPLPAR